MAGFSNIRRTVPPPPSEVQSKIDQLIVELKKRGVASDKCPRCNTFDWAVDFLQIPAGPVGAAGYNVPSPPTLFIPVASFACRNCGYMMYHNMRVLEGTR
jgi:hypothetical protein